MGVWDASYNFDNYDQLFFYAILCISCEMSKQNAKKYWIAQAVNRICHPSLHEFYFSLTFCGNPDRIFATIPI